MCIDCFFVLTINNRWRNLNWSLRDYLGLNMLHKSFFLWMDEKDGTIIFKNSFEAFQC